MTSVRRVNHPLLGDSAAVRRIRNHLKSPTFALALLEVDLQAGYERFHASRRICTSPICENLKFTDEERALAESILMPLYDSFEAKFIVRSSDGKGLGVWLRDG